MSVNVRKLRVDLDATAVPIVEDVSFSVAPGEVIGIVGESGSGKTTVALAMLGFARKGTRIHPGSVVEIDGTDIVALAPARQRSLRGKLVSYVPQDPSASLNPGMTIGAQLREGLTTGPDRVDPAEAAQTIDRVLKEVELPSTPEFLASYPSQISGGQQQRVCIAMAVARRPKLLILDEPTTGLDLSTQAAVLEMVGRLCTHHRMAAVYITHDLGVVAHVASKVIVLYAGRIMEEAPNPVFFSTPSHPYSLALLRSLPTVFERRALVPIPGQAPSFRERRSGCVFRSRCGLAQERCETEPDLVSLAPDAAHKVRCHFPSLEPWSTPATLLDERDADELDGGPVLALHSVSAFYGRKVVLNDISFSVRRGECLALVGQSGSGKSTLSRCLVGLHDQWTGTIEIAGERVSTASARRTDAQRRRVQYIFQNPYGSLNPRRSVGASIKLSMKHLLKDMRDGELDRRVQEVLDRVGLPRSYANRFPNELSGGEKQRIAIARGLASAPDLLICDEVTSALDVSVQASIIEVLRDLMDDGLSIVFVTHNLAVVRSLADRTIVLSNGTMIEEGATSEVIEAPKSSYTKDLLAHTLDIVRS